MLPGDYFAWNRGYKSRHHLINRLQILECLELLVGGETSLKNEVTQKSEYEMASNIFKQSEKQRAK